MSDNRLETVRSELATAVARLRAAVPGEPLGLALRDLGEVERKLGNRDAARASYEESVAILRAHGSPSRLAHTLRHLGDVYRETRHTDRARACYDEALALYRSYPEAAPLDLANAIRSVAVLQQASGNRAAARAVERGSRSLRSRRHRSRRCGMQSAVA